MSRIQDKAQTTESLNVSLETSGPTFWPCLKCGKATKEHRPAGMRICSAPTCRQECAQADMKAVAVVGDSPRFPCSTCGKETKEHVPPGTRICSSPVCSARLAMLKPLS